MRDILFKAKRIDTGEWVSGYLCLLVDIHGQPHLAIQALNERGCYDGVIAMVDRSTICEYTGLTDKNGTKIFEGDIVLHGYINQLGSFYDELPVSYKVNHGGYIMGEFKRLTPKTIEQRNVEVIGNIHDKEGHDEH